MARVARARLKTRSPSSRQSSELIELTSSHHSEIRMVSAGAEIKFRYSGKPRDANDGRREPEAAVSYLIALGGERYFRFFRTAYDVAIRVDFIGSRMHMKVTHSASVLAKKADMRHPRVYGLAPWSNSISPDLNVRYWPTADIASCTAHVCLWG